MRTPFSTLLLAALALLLVPASPAQIAADLLVLEGQTLDGSTVEVINEPFVNGDGEVGLTLDLSGDDGVFFDGSVIWRNSFALPSATLSGAEFVMGIGDEGEFIYSPALDGDDAVWTDLGLLAVEGTPAPGFGGDTLTTFHSRPTMIPSGQAYWIAGTNDGTTSTSSRDRVLYTSPGRTGMDISVVLRAGDPVVLPGMGTLPVLGGSGLGFDYAISDDGSNHIHDLNVDTGDSSTDGVIYLNGTAVARESTPSGDGDNWDNFDLVKVVNDGTYAFSGDTDGDFATDEFIAVNGTIVLREGDTVAGVTLGSTVRGLALNDSGQMLWAWTTDAGTSSEVLFLGTAADPAGTATVLVATGDSLDTDGDGSANFVVTDFDFSTLSGQGAGALTEDGVAYVLLEVVPVGGGDEVTGAFGFGEAGPGPVTFDASVSTDTIPAGGGPLVFTATLTNNTDAALPIDVWVTATGPVSRTRRLASGTLPAGASVTRSITLGIPAGLPSGAYDVALNVGDFGSMTVLASEMFVITKDGARAGGDTAFTVALDVNDALLSAAETPAVAARAVPTEMAAYPNPFGAETAFRFGLSAAGEVRLAVYDVLGREVAVLADGAMAAGAHTVALDGRGLAAGVYVWRLAVGETVQTGRVTLVR